MLPLGGQAWHDVIPAAAVHPLECERGGACGQSKCRGGSAAAGVCVEQMRGEVGAHLGLQRAGHSRRHAEAALQLLRREAPCRQAHSSLTRLPADRQLPDPPAEPAGGTGLLSRLAAGRGARIMPFRGLCSCRARAWRRAGLYQQSQARGTRRPSTSAPGVWGHAAKCDTHGPTCSASLMHGHHAHHACRLLGNVACVQAFRVPSGERGAVHERGLQEERASGTACAAQAISHQSLQHTQATTATAAAGLLGFGLKCRV